MVWKVSYIILFSGLWSLGFSQDKDFWFPEAVQEYEIAGFVGDDLEGNLWLITSQKTLLKKVANGDITEYEIPKLENTVLNGFVSREGIIFLSFMDVGYRSTFFWGNPEKGWKQLKSSFPNAILRFMEAEDGTIYAYGDWGSILELDISSNSYKRLPFPYFEHIRSATADNGKLYLGVRNIGLVEYSVEGSRVLKGSENISSDIDGILKDDKENPPSFLTLRGRYYKWQDGEYKFLTKAPIGRSTNKAIFIKNGIPCFAGAFGQVYIYQSEEWKATNLPVNNEISEFHLSRDGSLFVLDINGRLYRLQSSGKLVFTNSTRLEAMFGHSLDKSMNVQFVDVNNDELLDFTVNSSGINERINIFIQYENGLYREESARFFEEYPENIEHIWFQDISSDGNTDLLVMYNKESHFYINSYLYFQNKFVPHQSISLHSDSVQDLRDFVITDIDGDKDQDIILAFYYAKGRQKGAIVTLENTGYGWFEQKRKMNSKYRQYANVLWAGDLNNDGFQELIIGTYWSSDLIISENLNGTSQSLHFLPDSTNTTAIQTADIDRDGKPELFRLSWEYGLQVFDVQPDLTFQDRQNFYQDRSISVHSFSLADVNSDGWIDVLVNGDSGNIPFNHFLLNEDGRLHQKDAREFGFKVAENQKLIPIDFDRDGDFDIIALRDDENKIFENHTNPEHVLKIIHKSATGLTEQWKVVQDDTVTWGHQNNISGIGNGNAEFLTGLHSLDNNRVESADVEEFEYQVQNIQGTNQLVVTPKILVWESWLNYLNYLHIVLHLSSFYYYIITFASGTLILMFTYYIGTKKLDWEWKSLVTITLANSTLFWMLLLLSGNLGEFWRYGIPLGGVAAGSILPVFFSMQNRLFRVSQSEEEAKLQILDLMLRFSHGAWSNSVINRFNMLLLNVAEAKNNEIMQQIQERKHSFLKIVLPELKEIYALMVKAGYNELQIQMLNNLIEYFEELLVVGEQNINRDAVKISKKLEDLRNVLRTIRISTWKNYSCDMIEVVQQVTDLHRDTFVAKNIELDRRSAGSEEAWVLMPAARMAEIIDNIILNAIKAMNKSTERKMTFFIYHKAPKWILEVSDSGTGMKPDLFEKIFESGFSNHQSSGQGLYKSMETLKQFGGRISVKRSEIGNGTTFKIEYLEGEAP